MIRNNDWPVQSTLIDKLPGYHARLITWADLGEGPRGPRPPLFFLYLQNVLLFCFENRFIPCSFILSPGTLTLLYFAHNAVSCMSWKVKFSFGRGEGNGGTRPPLSEFARSAPGLVCWEMRVGILHGTRSLSFKAACKLLASFYRGA